MNAAICEERQGDRRAAAARLSRLYAAEVAAGRAEGADAKRALEKAWELTVQRMDFDAGVAAFQALAAAHPARPEPVFMLGNLLAFLGRHAEAAAAYGKAAGAGTGAAPSPLARVRRARELAAAGPGNWKEAEAAVRDALKTAAGQEELPAVVLRTARMLLDQGMPRGARELAAAAGEVLRGNADLALLEGDAQMAEGKFALAREAYLRARDLAEYPDEAEARAARASLGLVRSGAKEGAEAAKDFRDAPGEALAPVPPDEPILDFDDARLLVRPLAGVKLVDGAARFPPPAPGMDRRVALHFFPDLDATRAAVLEVRLRAEGGEALLRADLSDGMDQMSDLPPGRLHWPKGGRAETVGAAWRTLSIPFADFELDTALRTVPADLFRVKCVVLSLRGADPKAPPSLWIDSVVFRDASGEAQRFLGTFNDALEEASLVYEGTTPPFTRQITSPEMAMDLLPTGTTPVSKAILEAQNGTFELSMVGRGKGALRVRHGESGWFPSRSAPPFGQGNAAPDGPAFVRVVLGPPRDCLRFRNLTFMARGERGGERLRLRIEDARSADLGRTLPAEKWPRSLFPRAAGKDGAIVLAKEWRMYRVPFEAFPEVDRSGLAEIDFEIGSEVGNAPGATVFLDEIGLER